MAPGAEVVVAETPLAKLGLSICYDLRFGELYRALVERGAECLLVPSAFTLTTGRDHWEPLLRARAIETQCYVLAPAQWGAHDDAGLKESYGHAMIVDPWGLVIARASDGPGWRSPRSTSSAWRRCGARFRSRCTGGSDLSLRAAPAVPPLQGRDSYFTDAFVEYVPSPLGEGWREAAGRGQRAGTQYSVPRIGCCSLLTSSSKSSGRSGKFRCSVLTTRRGERL